MSEYGRVYGDLYASGYPDGPARAVWRWRLLPAAVRSILDVGCGRGALGLEVPEPIKVFGIDVAESAILGVKCPTCEGTKQEPPCKPCEGTGYINGMMKQRSLCYDRLEVCDLTQGVPTNWPYAAMLFCCDVLEHIEESDLDTFWRNVLSLLKQRAWVRLSIGLGKSVFKHKEYGQLHKNLWGFQDWANWLFQTVDLTSARGAAMEVGQRMLLFQGRLLAPKKRWKEANVRKQRTRLQGAQPRPKEKR